MGSGSGVDENGLRREVEADGCAADVRAAAEEGCGYDNDAAAADDDDKEEEDKEEEEEEAPSMRGAERE